MTYEQMKQMAIHDLIRHAQEAGDVASQECVMSRIDEVAEHWTGFDPAERNIVKDLCSRYEVEMEMVAA